MLNVDLSRALPPRAYLYFSAFMPGLFFVFSILLGCPELGQKFVLRTSVDAFVFSRFLPPFVGLFMAFVVGNAFMFFTRHLQWLIGRIYGGCRALRLQFDKHILFPYLRERMSPSRPAPVTNPSQSSAPAPTLTQRKPPSRWVVSLYARTSNRIQQIPSEEDKAALEWWLTLAKHLLLKRYDLERDKLPEVSFSPLQAVLTLPSAEEIRGSILMNALHATGWAALFATRFAGVLWSRWYLVFAFTMIGFGLLHDYFIAKQLTDPRMGNLLRIRAILREFPKIRATSTTKQALKKPSSEADQL